MTRNEYQSKYKLMLFLKDSSELYLDAKHYTVTYGDVMLLPPGIHKVQINPKGVVHKLEFEEYDIPADILFRIKEMSGCYSFENTMVMDLMLSVNANIKKYSGESINGLRTSIIHQILYFFESEATPCLYRIADKLVWDVIDYIDHNISKNFTLKDVCKHVKCSDSYICNIFQQYMQISVMKYVRSKRIERAEYLIRKGQKPSTIYKLCGFIDYSTFFRTYKSVLGKTPSLMANHHI